jgi:hypothetical protein
MGALKSYNSLGHHGQLREIILSFSLTLFTVCLVTVVRIIKILLSNLHLMNSFQRTRF